VITIDPGVRGAGVAVWEDNKLVLACYVKSTKSGRGYAVAEELAYNVDLAVKDFRAKIIVCEYPRFYGSTHQQGDPNDLIDVAVAGSAICARLDSLSSHIESVFPSDWKGQVPKQKMLVRIWEALTEEERAVVQKTNKSDTEDILDAIGIGLHKLNRLNKRVFAND
jgi:hypothetical protein